jgi:hypothetical protein
MVNTIRFSSDYQKLPVGWEGTSAVLMGIDFLSKEDLKNPKFKAFLDYDTSFRGKEGKYVLPDDDCLILFFFHPGKNVVFTTLRRCTEEKWAYYENRLFDSFTLEYVGEEEKK